MGKVMKKKIFFAAIIFINLFVFPAFAAESPIIDTITQQEIKDLAIQIPSDTIPGTHSMLIQINNPDGSIAGSKDITFCLDLDAIVHWNVRCTNVPTVVSSQTLSKISHLNELPGYTVLMDPKRTSQNNVIALAVLSVIGISTTSVGLASNSSSGNSLPNQGDIEMVDSAAILSIVRDEKWGDRRRTWRFPFTRTLDGWFASLTVRISKFSPMLARALFDGQYLRGMFGSAAVILYPLALITGIAVGFHTHFQAMPPSFLGLILLMTFGIFDSSAGLIAGLALLLGTLVTGHLTRLSEFLTMLGLLAICFAPALIASTIRPIRRLITDSDTGWERISDYFLASLLSGWTVSKMVGGLNGLAGKQFAINGQVRQLMFIAMGLVFFRLLFEDLATYLYPKRMMDTHLKLNEASSRQRVVSLLVKSVVFIMVAGPFVGYSVPLWIGVGLFIIPFIIAMTIGEKFPKKISLGRWLPKGALELIFLAIIGGFLTKGVQNIFPNPHQYLMWGFVVLAVPTLILRLIGNFADETDSEEWRDLKIGKWIYRFGGIVVFIGLVYMVQGIDIAGNIIKFVK
jgi:hypothetical protein